MSTMRAIQVSQFGGPEQLKLETVSVPVPKEGEVLIRVMAVGVNPFETHVRAGEFGPRNMPFTPGSDAAGFVEKVGTGVTEFKAGDRVYTTGTLSGSYAEFAIAIPQYMSHLSDRLSYAQGASIGIPYHTAYKALHLRAQAKPGETVLIHGGSGAVGIASIQAAKAFGLRVIATAGTKGGQDLVRQHGADAVFCHRGKGYMDKIKEYTENKGVDIILEMLADVNLHNDLDLLAVRARVVIIGCRGNIEINPRLTMLKETSIIGMGLMTGSDVSMLRVRKRGGREGE
ncbi:quinone oxidoreductase [Aplysia californica]|uniref:Quinone oxidoreductase n=1 Tax=Aplysia californica TaxID=6500 RepID=A0ABM1A987_APLCA|nr:quinone oxidoreductase [Aplysia californica]